MIGNKSGNLLNLSSTASTAGTISLITSSGTTTGIVTSIVGAATTTGTLLKLTAATGTITTGFYLQCYDGGTSVLTIGNNGHITSNQTTAPTIAVTTQNGITAAAITAGSTDVCGTITTTGTNNNGGNTVLTVTFNKTYTTAPKSVVLTPVNNSANTLIASTFVTTTATTFVINVIGSASAGATPSWTYQVIA